MIHEVTTIANLTSLSPTHGDWAVVLNYYPDISGGGGEFYFDEHSTATVDDGIIFMLDSSRLEGRWIRQYEGKLNVLFFGVLAYQHNLSDNAERINKAIDYTHKLARFPNNEGKDLTVFFPDGIYPIRKAIILRSFVSLKGDSNTEIKCDERFEDEYIFEGEPGRLEYVHLENFMLLCNGTKNNRRGGLRLVASTINNFDGGAWYCTFKNLRILNASNDGIALLGGDSDEFQFALTHQYLVFENIAVQRVIKECTSMTITGLVLNTSFLRCDFEIPYDYNGDNGIDGVNVYIGSKSNIGEIPTGLKFTQCATGGHVRYGFRIQNAQTITFDTCWIEQTDIGFEIENSHSIDIINCRFANAAAQGTANKNGVLFNSFILDEDPNLLGRCIGIKKSSVNVKDNYTAVTDYGADETSPIYTQVMDRLAHSRFILSTNESAVNAEDNAFQHIRLNATHGITQYDEIQMVSNYYYNSPSDVWGIETGGRKIIIIKLLDKYKPNVIQRINSTINAGEFLTIRAETYQIIIEEWNPVAETYGRNIYHSGEGALTLPVGAIAHYLKLDGINNQELCCYQLISTTGHFGNL